MSEMMKARDVHRLPAALKTLISFLRRWELQGVKNGSQQRKNIRYILQFFFDKGENASQVAKIVTGVYGPDTVSASYV
ncbi:hypothetical protein TNCV_3039011 [Trichonephila clavipes]|nr:hypothetical protein TNCV_3039011 [Trichonephila clavipes]